MENKNFCEEAINRINSKKIDSTKKLADSILMLVNDTITNANEKNGKINSVKKYKNLGSLSKKESSLIEKSSYEICEDGLIIKLNYSKLMPKYNNELNTYDNGNGGKFEDESIDYELLNQILSKYNIEVKKEERLLTAPKYCNVSVKMLTIELKRKEQVKRENNEDNNKEDYIKKIKQVAIKTASLLTTILDFNKDIFSELLGELNADNKDVTLDESLNKLRCYLKLINTFLAKNDETEEEKFEKAFGQTKEEYMNDKKTAQNKKFDIIDEIKKATSPVIEKVKSVITTDEETITKDSKDTKADTDTSKAKAVCDTATEIYEKVKEVTKPILDRVKESDNTEEEEKSKVKNILETFFEETSNTDLKSTLNSILNKIPKK